MPAGRPQLGEIALVLVGAVGSFVLTTVIMDEMPDVLLIGLTVSLAALIVVVPHATGMASFVRATPTSSLVLAASGGVLAFWAAPLLSISQRATDAPSGAETLFFATACWGAISVVAAYVARLERLPATALAGALVSLAGSAAVLANWERPSSFSPFAKFPAQEALMLVAGTLFAVGTLAIVKASAAADRRRTAVVAIGSAGVFALVFSASSVLGTLPTLTRLSTEIVLLGVSQAAFIWGWTRVTAHSGVGRSGSVLLAVPIAVTGLFALERLTGVFGPTPFQIPGVIAGSAICLAGALCVWFAARGRRVTPASRSVAQAGVVVAWLAVATAFISLLRPALQASAEGVLGEGFSATWTMVGYESAAGWLPLAAAVAVLSAALGRPAGLTRPAWISALLSALAAVAAFPFLADTTLHTWNRWVPPAVQQTYGTEYARFSVNFAFDPVRLASLVLVVLAATLFLLSLVMEFRRPAKSESEEYICLES